MAQKILEALRGLRFGSVEITVHEGRIVQIERREKCRLSVTCPDATDIPEDRDH
ncbi:YezD family protein [Methylomagnum sp.]